FIHYFFNLISFLFFYKSILIFTFF
uniref:Uncharacterized protein n=1 Tax=Amphimedon queenslandica TaxID=400682 RepID=A0A1X7UBR1_AMPQE